MAARYRQPSCQRRGASLPDRIGMPEVTFHWNSVAPYIQSAIRYLHVTANGRQWIANLYSNVFRAERDIALGGPQK